MKGCLTCLRGKSGRCIASNVYLDDSYRCFCFCTHPNESERGSFCNAVWSQITTEFRPNSQREYLKVATVYTRLFLSFQHKRDPTPSLNPASPHDQPSSRHCPFVPIQNRKRLSSKPPYPSYRHQSIRRPWPSRNPSNAFHHPPTILVFAK